MYYGIYKNLRNSAWRCLIEFQIDRLPVDILQITRRAGIRVVRNSAVNVLQPNENGKSYFDGTQWLIIYNDQNSTELSRFTVAHELGHIFLGHELSHVKYAEINEFHKGAKSEKQADMFAYRLLCPACVLWGLNLHTAEDIALACRVDSSVAHVRAKRMRQLYQKNCFLITDLEQEVYQAFYPFIESLQKHAPPPQFQPMQTSDTVKTGETNE